MFNTLKNNTNLYLSSALNASVLGSTSEPKILSCLFTKLRLSLDGKSSNQLFFHPVEVVGTSVGLTRPFEISRQKMFLLLI